MPKSLQRNMVKSDQWTKKKQKKNTTQQKKQNNNNNKNQHLTELMSAMCDRRAEVHFRHTHKAGLSMEIDKCHLLVLTCGC